MGLQKRGIVAKVSGNNCIVLTPEGTFTRIRKPSSGARVGEEVAYNRNLNAATIIPSLLVASLLVAFLIYPSLQQLVAPQAVAYVSLDIHHSMEMAVDSNHKVVGVTSFNNESSVQIDQLDLNGKDLNHAVAVVIDNAIDMNYIGTGQNNLVVSTIVPSENAPNSVGINENELYQVLEESISRRGYTGQVKIYTASQDVRLAAEEQRLTTGQYMIYEQLVAAGHNLAIEDINRQSLGQLAAAYNIDGVAPRVVDDNITSGEVSIAKDNRNDFHVSRGYTSHTVRNVSAPSNNVAPATQAALAETSVSG